MIEIKEVSKKYDSQIVVNNLSLKVSKGEVLGFLGPNGAGKTTTIKCLTGILQCDRGTIHINGKNIEDNTFDIKNKIGFLPEQVGLYGRLNPKQILEFYGGFYDISKEEIDERSEELLVDIGDQLLLMDSSREAKALDRR